MRPHWLVRAVSPQREQVPGPSNGVRERLGSQYVGRRGKLRSTGRLGGTYGELFPHLAVPG
ncbi:hypothetical protein [Streptomyces europaeiscabiei]|uniref:hypothetical protein n=1 Tax=Streptomyces europaeiscabiei TaxID=146819 RepID=UPI0038F6FF4C